MMNLWPGIGVDDWLEPFNGRTPLTAEYEYVNIIQMVSWKPTVSTATTALAAAASAAAAWQPQPNHNSPGSLRHPLKVLLIPSMANDFDDGKCIKYSNNQH